MDSAAPTNALPARHVHRLGEVLTVDTVAAEQAGLLRQLEGDQPLWVDLAGIKECDCAGLQLLCALRRSALQSGRRLEWLGTSAALANAAFVAALPPDYFRHATPGAPAGQA